MKKYEVTVYYHTYATVEIEANTEEEAIVEAYYEAGKEEYDSQILHNITTNGDPEIEEITD